MNIIFLILIILFFLFKMAKLNKVIDKHETILVFDENILLAILHKSGYIDWKQPTSIIKYIKVKFISLRFEEEFNKLKKS